MEFEILRGKNKPAFYEQIAKTLGFRDIKDLTATAVKADNFDALTALAHTNVYAVTAELGKPDYASYFAQKYKEGSGQNFIPELYFMVRAHAPRKFKILLQQLTKGIILKSSLNISGRGQRGMARYRVKYFPGINEFDLEQTFFNYIQRGQVLSYSDIIGLERRQIKKNVVLMLDTSGSMFGELLLNAALTTSVLSYAMSKDFTSVILFSQEAFVLKGIKSIKTISKLIDQILESEAVGFTNITVGLRKGLDELKKVKGHNARKTFGILISDGEYNRGQHPALIAHLFPKLHVIGMPSEQKKDPGERGQQICREIARAGRGTYLHVEKFSEIPRAMMKLLSKI